MADPDFTADLVRSLLDLDPQTGILRWRPGSNRNAGKIAGCQHSDGYTVIKIMGRQLAAHRVVWLHHYGRWPTMSIDHIDGRKHNNAIANLRDVSLKMNSQNQRRAQKINKLGVLGVCEYKGRFRATIFLGTFNTIEEASQVYLDAKRKLHPGCTI